MSIFFYNLNFFKRILKLRCENKAEATFFSPLPRKPDCVYKTEEKEATVSFSTKLLILCLYWI